MRDREDVDIETRGIHLMEIEPRRLERSAVGCAIGTGRTSSTELLYFLSSGAQGWLSTDQKKK